MPSDNRAILALYPGFEKIITLGNTVLTRGYVMIMGRYMCPDAVGTRMSTDPTDSFGVRHPTVVPENFERADAEADPDGE
jgi:hypothetical protein